ncbi:MAG: M48 family metallopeptidase [Eubacteriales bacterium]
MTLNLAYDLVMRCLAVRQKKKPLPENVRDIYDEAEYARWREYSAEKSRAGLVSTLADFVLGVVLFGTNVLSTVYGAMPGGAYLKSILLMLLYALLLTVWSLPYEYYVTMKIEGKYGFNKTSGKTFVTDTISNFVINLLVNVVLMCFAMLMYDLMGLWFFAAVFVLAAVVSLAVSMLSMTFMRVFNQFTPLPDGPLRDTLVRMFRDAGYELTDIRVMDASRRTTKVNAFCTGLGRFKKIALYDNLVENYTEDEIAAVFAHELGHFRHGDTAKMSAYNLLRMAVLTALIAAFAAVPQISTDYGFPDVNFAFAILALTGVLLTPAMTLLNIPSSILGRRYEYRADRMAVELGYGEAMVSVLKKLTRDNFAELNPHPVLVALEHSHPTVGQRIDAIRNAEETK